MTHLDLQIAFDGIAQELLKDGMSADAIEDLLTEEALRVAQELRDEQST